MKIDKDNQLGATSASASSPGRLDASISFAALSRRLKGFLIAHEKKKWKADEEDDRLKEYYKNVSQFKESVLKESGLKSFPYEPMWDPVVVAAGETYDRANIDASSQRLLSPVRAVARNMGGDEPGFMKRGEKNAFDILLGRVAQGNECRIEGIVPAFPAECFPYEPEPLRVPVVVAAGETYDRANIDDSSQRFVSPMRRGEKNVCDILLREIAQGNECREATRVLREMTKPKTAHRAYLGYWKTGAIPLLVSLLSSSDSQTQENAVTVLHNLSICDENQTAIAALGAIPSIVQVLRNGGTMEARANAAATLCNLAKVDENKQKIAVSGAIPALVDLLRDGDPIAKNDSLCALWILYRDHENGIPCVREGMIPLLMKLVSNHSECLDESLELLAMVADRQEGAEKVGKAGAVTYLMDLIKDGCSPPRSKAKAVAILHAICSYNRSHLKEFRDYRNGYIIALTNLSKSGMPNDQTKASVFLDMIMKQEHISIKLAKEEKEGKRLNFI